MSILNQIAIGFMCAMSVWKTGEEWLRQIAPQMARASKVMLRQKNNNFCWDDFRMPTEQISFIKNKKFGIRIIYVNTKLDI